MGWTPPRRPWCARVVALVTTEQEASVSEVSTIGLDLAKRVFQAHGADASGKVVFRKRLRREQVLPFFAGRPACVVAMEACSSAHYWARAIGELGHTVRLIPPAYVKPFVKRQKNDSSDAEAICEAAQRPTMRFVAVKSEAAQASAAIFRTRDLLVRQRTPAHQCVARPARRIWVGCSEGTQQPPSTGRTHRRCGALAAPAGQGNARRSARDDLDPR